MIWCSSLNKLVITLACYCYNIVLCNFYIYEGINFVNNCVCEILNLSLWLKIILFTSDSL